MSPTRLRRNAFAIITVLSFLVLASSESAALQSESGVLQLGRPYAFGPCAGMDPCPPEFFAAGPDRTSIDIDPGDACTWFQLTGSTSSPLPYNLDIYFFDDARYKISSKSAWYPDEEGHIPPGATQAIIILYRGDDVAWSFDLIEETAGLPC